jgi:hypothetical protein
MLYRAIPYESEQGIYSGLTGNQIEPSGNLFSRIREARAGRRFTSDFVESERPTVRKRASSIFFRFRESATPPVIIDMRPRRTLGVQRWTAGSAGSLQ